MQNWLGSQHRAAQVSPVFSTCNVCVFDPHGSREAIVLKHSFQLCAAHATARSGFYWYLCPVHHPTEVYSSTNQARPVCCATSAAKSLLFFSRPSPSTYRANWRTCGTEGAPLQTHAAPNRTPLTQQAAAGSDKEMQVRSTHLDVLADGSDGGLDDLAHCAAVVLDEGLLLHNQQRSHAHTFALIAAGR